MRRSLAAIVVWCALSVTATCAWATQVCPFDPGELLIRACPCDQFNTRVAYLKCVNKQVSGIRHLGCDTSQISRCATFSVCGMAPEVTVCCDRKGRASITDESDCLAVGGTPMPDAASICDVTCMPRRHTIRH